VTLKAKVNQKRIGGYKRGLGEKATPEGSVADSKAEMEAEFND